MALTRKILFFAFVLLYLVICPLLLLYASGYSFHPLKNKLVQTGMIYVASAPPQATVFLGKSRYLNKTPTLLEELLPGNYTVGLSLKAYKPWSHSIVVRPGKAVALTNIILIPRSWKRTTISSDTFKHLLPLLGTKFVIVAKGNSLGTYSIYDCEEKKLSAMVPPTSEFFDFPVISIFTQEKSRVIIVFGGPLWERKYLYILLDDDKSSIYDISGLLPKQPQNIVWNSESDTDIFALYDNYCNYLDIQSMAYHQNYIQDIKGFGLAGRWVYAIDNENNVVRYSYDSDEKDMLYEGGIFGKKLFNESYLYEIERLSNTTLLFSGEQGRLLVNLPPYEIEPKRVVGKAFDKDKNTLLYWTKNSINLAEFSVSKSEASLFAEAVKITRLYDRGRDIQQCFWAYKGTHIVFQDSDTLYLLYVVDSADGQRQDAHVEEIVTIKAGTTFSYSDTDGSVYYIDEQTGNFLSTNVAPHEEPFFTPFAQKRKAGG